ncbi:MAG: hypothetical protein Q4F72_01750 [Desulfovibrionaceae bacterium]|nr:hypothetical protein [Desulfovibrionaceae bacterium]
MAISFTAPSAKWFASSKPALAPTANAGAIHFDGLNGGNSFTIMGKDLVTPCGYGFYSAGRIYMHVGFAETLDAGEWLFYRVELDGKFMLVHSPILDRDVIVLPVSGTLTERTFENVRMQGNSNGSYSFYYTPPQKDEVCVSTIAPGDWLSEHIDPVLVNVRETDNFVMITFSPRNEGDNFPMEDFLYTMVVNRFTGEFLGRGLRRAYYAMPSRYDSYIELGYAYGPVGEHDWWPVLYQDLWAMTLKTSTQPVWTFGKDRISVNYRNGRASQKFEIQ